MQYNGYIIFVFIFSNLILIMKHVMTFFQVLMKVIQIGKCYYRFVHLFASTIQFFHHQ